MNKIEEFIKRRWGDTDAHWQDGNCYWFAKILTLRFPYLSIYYLPIVGHFIAGDGKEFYDSLGKVSPQEPCIQEKDIDRLLYTRLIRDCYM